MECSKKELGTCINKNREKNIKINIEGREVEDPLKLAEIMNSHYSNIVQV